MIHRVAVVAMASVLAALSIACGDDSDSDLSSAADYYDNIQEVNAQAAEEIAQVAADFEGAERYQAGADVFTQLAKDAEEFNPSVETAVVHDAYILTANLISDALNALADGDETAADTLDARLDDFEFACRNLVDVARIIFEEGRELDCTFGYELIE